MTTCQRTVMKEEENSSQKMCTNTTETTRKQANKTYPQIYNPTLNEWRNSRERLLKDDYLSILWAKEFLSNKLRQQVQEVKGHFNIKLGITIPDLKLYFRVLVSKQHGIGISWDMNTNRAEDTEKTTHRHNHLMVDEVLKSYVGE